MSFPAPERVSSPPAQLSFELAAPPATAETPLLPARMVNEYVYCPRVTHPVFGFRVSMRRLLESSAANLLQPH
jgi:hypothetical protein